MQNSKTPKHVSKIPGSQAGIFLTQANSRDPFTSLELAANARVPIGVAPTSLCDSSHSRLI
ncbi:hypothetical protein MES4922_650003 [Mesorhizobium ventifaucium]|uniref:Uncharacterized protein n=1 Tax=Mesorhizobium ventifaucium TaxID=666020 RepID=A0ABN8KDB7_9HYPH|nr:hypothetical protein MES4922_650003 [Mesorhizobium ventifaucium]